MSDDGYHVGHDDDYELVFEYKPRLLRWVDSLNPEYNIWINLQQVTTLHQTEDGEEIWLTVHDGAGNVSNTSDPGTIGRFWEQWEIV